MKEQATIYGAQSNLMIFYLIVCIIVSALIIRMQSYFEQIQEGFSP